MDIMDLRGGITVGLDPDVSFEDYQKIPALRSGVIKDGLFYDADKQPVVSPLHIRAAYEQVDEKSTDSMDFGAALHCLLLEPQEFTERYAFFEGRRDPRTKAYQDFIEENQGKKVLKPASWQWCLQAAQILCEDPVVKPYIESGRAEVTGTTVVDTVPCKVRFDWLSESKDRIVDVKTAQDVGPDAFWRAWRRYGYGLQLALYQHVYELITDRYVPVVVVAIENHPPFCPVVYEVPEALLSRDLFIVQRVIERVRQCLEDARWPSFATTEQPLAVPDSEMEEVDVVVWAV